jgi:hypothetical protein
MRRHQDQTVPVRAEVRQARAEASGGVVNAPMVVTLGRRCVDLGQLDPTCPARWHGTATAYRKAKCRCPHAREAHRLYEKRRLEGRNQRVLVDATGTRRRIQGLWALGHSSEVIAHTCGGRLDRRQIVRFCHQPWVMPGYRDLIAAVYKTLIIRPGASVKTRRRALVSGYPLPVQWGANIDDPNAEPDPIEPLPVDLDLIDEVSVELALSGHRIELTDAELIAVIQAGVAREIPLSKLADQLGVNYFGARKMLTGEVTPRRQQQARVEAALREMGDSHNDQTIGALVGVHHQTVTRARRRLADQQQIAS